MKSLNNLIVCEPYKGAKGIRSSIRSGVAVVKQKTGVIGLKVLADAYISKDITLKAGSTIYVLESILFQFSDQYSKPLDSDFIEEPFVLVNYGHVALHKD